MATSKNRTPVKRAMALDSVAPRISLGDIVADRLRDAILNDDLTPGQHLREEEISERLQVSRGPVRDAFILLEGEGLVRLSRNRGASVVELSVVDLGEVYSLRSAVEELAVRLATRRHTREDLEILQNSMAELQVALDTNLTEQEAARLDVEFHDALFKAAHHERLYTSWSSIRMQVYWFLRRRNIASPDWRVYVIQGHQRIFDLISAGEEAAAIAEIHNHIRLSYGRIIAGLAEDGADSGEESPKHIAETFLL